MYPKARLVFLVEAGTHLLCDALVCPYRMHERVRVRPLLRSVSAGMLLMWDRGLHSFKMVNATLDRGSRYLGRLPANVKFPLVKPLSDGSYLSWIAPDRQSRRKGATPLQVRVIEYSIEVAGMEQSYRLIADKEPSPASPDCNECKLNVVPGQLHREWYVPRIAVAIHRFLGVCAVTRERCSVRRFCPATIG